MGGKDVPQPAPQPAPCETTHKVVKGDTLWSLAVRYLGDGQKWKAIQKANGGSEKCDPYKLRIGSVLKIPAKEGKKQ
jgi:nucleoid-associated protein YgaU